jgi:hypothetical protein
MNEEEEDKKFLRNAFKKELEHALNELMEQGFFEREVLEELYLDLHAGDLDKSPYQSGPLFLQAEFDSQEHQLCITLKKLVEKMIDFYDSVHEDYSEWLWRAATEFEELAKVCAEAAERHAASGLPPPGKG